MRNYSVWSSLVLLSVMTASSLAAVDAVAVTNQEDTQCTEQEVAVTAYFTTPRSRQPAELFVTARLKPGYWLYSITQPSGGPHRTIIELEESPAFRLRGRFIHSWRLWDHRASDAAQRNEVMSCCLTGRQAKRRPKCDVRTAVVDGDLCRWRKTPR